MKNLNIQQDEAFEKWIEEPGVINRNQLESLRIKVIDEIRKMSSQPRSSLTLKKNISGLGMGIKMKKKSKLPEFLTKILFRGLALGLK